MNAPSTLADDEISGLVQRSETANAALVRGDIDAYLALIDHSQDYVLMAPFGGPPTRGFDTSSENRAGMSRFFRAGSLTQEVVSTYTSHDLAVLVTVERVRAEIGGLAPQDWVLRVTQVFRRAKRQWQLVHRHADPLANGISLEHAAALARGASDER
jgi:ketosteroid isomerase-like protein